MRVETDSLGALNIPDEAYYGIHTKRSCNNFVNSNERIPAIFIKSYLLVKKAAAEANFKSKVLSPQKYQSILSSVDFWLKECEKELQAEDNILYKHLLVDPLQGGAGTSLNMNINEIICNKALELEGYKPGTYDKLHPLDDVNKSQSTNDTYGTALKIASIYKLKELQDSFSYLQRALQDKENEFKGVIKLGRTQMQDAVPLTLGQEFGAYAQAIARDRWRLYNCEERLRSVNIGGTAVGNSISANREYVLSVTNVLKRITGLPIAKSEDLIDSTQNLDMFVEVHGIIKAGATTIKKLCNDLRLLSSGPQGGLGEITLPAMQAGSSIMPGKVNPVIPENGIQITEVVFANDAIISNCVSQGNLELNAFMPLIAHTFLKTMDLLTKQNKNLADKCISGIKANKERCRENLIKSSAIAATLIPVFGYEKIQSIVNSAELNNSTFTEELLKSQLVDEHKLLEILSNELGLKIE